MTLGDHGQGQPYGHGHGGGVPPQGGGYGAPQGGYGGAPQQPPYGQPSGAPQQPPYGQPSGPPQQPPYGQPSGPPQPDPYVPAAPGFGSGQFSEPPGFGPPPPPPKGGSRFWLTILAGLAVVVVIAACGVGGFYLFRDDGTPAATPSDSPSASVSGSASASPSPSASPVDISSRSTDPKALTEKELFGDKNLQVADDSTGETRSYKVVKTQALKDCSKAVTGDPLAKALKRLGCNQVVRAAINSSDGKYGATAGVINLKNKGHSQTIDPLIDKEKGSYNGLVGPGASGKINKAAVIMYWQEHGHYMMYVVICRGDGKQISQKDDRLEQMASDLLLIHLISKLNSRSGG